MLLEMWVGCSWTHAVFTTKIFSAPPYAGLLPESLANIIRMCLDQVPQDRPTAMEVQQVLPSSLYASVAVYSGDMARSVSILVVKRTRPRHIVHASVYSFHVSGWSIQVLQMLDA